MSKGFQCDECGRMYLGEPITELEEGEYKAVYSGTNDICRACFISGFTKALRENQSIRVPRRSK